MGKHFRFQEVNICDLKNRDSNPLKKLFVKLFSLRDTWLAFRGLGDLRGSASWISVGWLEQAEAR